MHEYMPFFQSEKRSIAEKVSKYFEHSGLETKIHYDEEKEVYILSVPSNSEMEAKKLYQDFYFVERDRVEKEELDQSTILTSTSYDVGQQDIASDEVALADMVEQELSNDEIASDDIDQQELSNDEIASADMNQQELSNDEIASADMNQQESDSDQTTLGYTEDMMTESAISIDDDKDSNQDDLNPDYTDTDEAALDDMDSSSSVKSLLSGSGSYVMKSEKYKDYISTQYVFLILGIAGLIFVILNAIEVFSFFYGLFSNLIMGALFLFFILVGLSTAKKARLLKLEIDEEINMTDKINEWLHNNVTEDFLETISNNNISEELDYIKKTETIRDMLITEFGELDPNYLDRLIEEFYSENFDKTETYNESE